VFRTVILSFLIELLGGAEIKSKEDGFIVKDRLSAIQSLVSNSEDNKAIEDITANCEKAVL